MSKISTVKELEAIYGHPGKPSLVKEVRQVIPQYRAYIEAASFCTLATAGPEGLDCSPRGDLPGFVRIQDDRTLMMPDRRGNNRIDSLKNIVRDPRVALCFLIQGVRNALRVNGEAHLSVDPETLASFAVNGKEPRSIIVIKTMAIYFQCGRAMVRSRLWEEDAKIDPKSLPSAGDVLAELSKGEIGGKTYDDKWEARARSTLW